MCKAKPRPRCSQHASARLEKITAQYEKQRQRVDEYRGAGDTRLGAAEAQLEEMRRDVLVAKADFNATLDGLTTHGNMLVDMLNNNPDDPRIPAASLAVLEGHIQYNERQRQAKMMPKLPKGADKETRQANRSLATARERIATSSTRMAMNDGDLPAWQQWREVHATASAEALDAHAHVLTVQEHGPGAWARLSDKDRDAFRDAAREQADFTTPEAPIPLEETAATITDQRQQTVPDIEHLGGAIDPVDPTVDTPTWRDDRRRRAEARNATESGPSPQDDNGDNPTKGGEKKGSSSKNTDGKGDPRRQTERDDRELQKRRSQRARQSLLRGAVTASQIRAGARRMGLNDMMNGRGSTDPKGRVDSETAMSADGTGLLVLIELLKPPSANS